MNKYNNNKQRIRDIAIMYQQDCEPQSWQYIAEITAYFTKQGKRYGLLKEFRENGVI